MLKTTTEILYQIKAPHFVAGLAAESLPPDGTYVIDAAPIIRYLIGWEIEAVRAYCDKKKWIMKAITY